MFCSDDIYNNNVKRNCIFLFNVLFIILKLIIKLAENKRMYFKEIWLSVLNNPNAKARISPNENPYLTLSAIFLLNF